MTKRIVWSRARPTRSDLNRNRERGSHPGGNKLGTVSGGERVQYLSGRSFQFVGGSCRGRRSGGSSTGSRCSYEYGSAAGHVITGAAVHSLDRLRRTTRDLFNRANRDGL
ncbi:hypothetical protein ACLKA7_001419 [Drosophila subpalustris]